MSKNANKINEEFSQIYDEFYLQIYKYCLSRLSCDSDFAYDAAQETFLVLFNKMSEGETFDNPRAFLYVTATNFIKKRFNQIKIENERLAPLDEYQNSLIVADNDSIAEKLNFEEFTAALDKLLDSEEKRLYTLRFVESRRVKDIAAEIGIEEHYCALKITRLRRKIIKRLSDYY